VSGCYGSLTSFNVLFADEDDHFTGVPDRPLTVHKSKAPCLPSGECVTQLALVMNRVLEESADRIALIAEECGFSGEEQMRAAFMRLLQIQPRDYRKRFGAAS
jgi:hypothetical protein